MAKNNVIIAQCNKKINDYQYDEEEEKVIRGFSYESNSIDEDEFYEQEIKILLSCDWKFNKSSDR